MTPESPMMREPRVYELKGPGLEITYRRSDGQVDAKIDESSYDNLDANLTVEPEVGILVTAVLLPSSRSGIRMTLALLLPEVEWQLTRTVSEKADVTGVAVVTDIYKEVVGGPPPVLQKYGVRPLEGTAVG